MRRGLLCQPPAWWAGFLSMVVLLLCGVSLVRAVPPWDVTQYAVVYVDLPTQGQFGATGLLDVNAHGYLLGTAGLDPFLLELRRALPVPLSCPGTPILTLAEGVNVNRQVAGTCALPEGTMGFVLTPGGRGAGYTLFAAPNATITYGKGINDLGHVVGLAFASPESIGQAFLRRGRRFLPLTVPWSDRFVPTSLTNTGVIVGYAFDANGLPQGVQLRQGQAVHIAVPDATHLFLWDINSHEQMVGMAFFADRPSESVYFDGTAWWAITLPGPGIVLVDVAGLNDSGQIVGRVFLEQPSTPETGDLVIRGFVVTPVPGDASAPALAATATTQRQGPITQEDTPPVSARLRVVLEGCDDLPAGVVVPMRLAALTCR